MNPTNSFRYVLDKGGNSVGPCAIRPCDGLCFKLQQWWESTYEGESGEWWDIEVAEEILGEIKAATRKQVMRENEI